MTGAEQGFLLLTSHLGDPARPVLTVSQFRTLADRMLRRQPASEERDLQLQDLLSLGYGREMADRILRLLRDESLLHHYISRGKRLDCVPVTRVTDGYPLILRQRLGQDSPGTLWGKGDLSLLNHPAISLVGSRELKQQNRLFAEKVGKAAAEQGFVLLSGNAKGADQAAQEACLAAGGEVVSVVADRLDVQPEREDILYLSEDGFDLPFSPQRALSRNRVIHGMGRMTFVAQCTLEKGGTWDGAVSNLKRNYSPVFCYDDGSPAAVELTQRGATLIKAGMLDDLRKLLDTTVGLQIEL